MYLRHSSVLLERFFSFNVATSKLYQGIAYSHPFQLKFKLLLKQLSVWPISEAFLLPIVQKTTILM